MCVITVCGCVHNLCCVDTFPVVLEVFVGMVRGGEGSFGPPVQGVPDDPLVPRLRDRNIITVKKRNEYKAMRQKKMKKPLGVVNWSLPASGENPLQRVTMILDCRCRGCQMPP